MRTCDCLVGWHAHGTDVVDVQFTVDETSLYSLGADGKVRFPLFLHEITSHIAAVVRLLRRVDTVLTCICPRARYRVTVRVRIKG